MAFSNYYAFNCSDSPLFQKIVLLGKTNEKTLLKNIFLGSGQKRLHLL
jgi:hypothetical protein